MAAEGGHVEVLQKLLNWAKNLQLTREELKNQLWMSKDNSGKTAWHNAATVGHVELLEKLWKCAEKTPTKTRVIQETGVFVK